MSCILRNNNYSEITDKYGITQGEMLIREYAKSLKNDIEDIEPTTLEQIDIFHKNIQDKQLNTLKNALNLNPNLSKKEITLGLKGIKKSIVIRDLIESYPNRFKLQGGKLFITDVENTGEPFDTFRELANQDNSVQPMIDFLNQDNIQDISEDIVSILEKLSDKFNIPFEIDNNLPSKGMIKDGVVYVNLTNASLDTPFHEYLHPFLLAIKEQSPSIYKLLASKVKNLTDLQGNNIYNSLSSLYDKDELVDEAIVHALGLQTIGQLEETPNKVSFLELIKQAFIRMFQAFSKSGKNFDISLPFKSVLDMFLNDDVDITPYTSGTFFQKKSEVEVLTTLEKLNDSIVRVEVDSVEQDGEKTKIYQNLENPDKKYKSVHEEYIDPFYIKVYGKHNTFHNADKTSAEIGNYFHTAMEDVTELLINKDGTINKNPLPFKSLNIPTFEYKGSIAVSSDEADYLYKVAYDYMKGLISKYEQEFGPNARFITEQRVIRESISDDIPSIVGTVDLLILGDGKFSIYDWKTMSTQWFINNTMVQKPNVDENKEAAYKLQLGQYAQMFKLMTGWELYEAIAVPIEMNLKGDPAKHNDPKLEGNFILNLDIESNPQIISDPVTMKADKIILFPVIVSGKDLENKYLSDLVNKLQLLIQKEKMSISQGSSKTDREALKGIRIDELRAMISWLTIQQTSQKIQQRIDYVAKEVEKELDLTDLDKVNTEKLILLKEELSYYTDLSSIFKEEVESDPNLANTLAQYQWKVNGLIQAISDKNSKVIVSLAANKFNIRNIDKLERKYSTFNRYMKDTSSISNIKTMAAMSSMKDLYNNIANKNSTKTLKKLQSFMNLTQDDFDMFFDTVDTSKKGKLKLIERYSQGNIQELYKEIAAETKFIKGLEKHFDIDRVKIHSVWRDQVLRAEANFINNVTGFSDIIIEGITVKHSTPDELNNDLKEWIVKYARENASTFYTPLEINDENARFYKLNKVLNAMQDMAEYYTQDLLNKFDPFKYNKEGQVTGIKNIYHTLKEESKPRLYSEAFLKLISNKQREDLYNLIMEINHQAYEYESIINSNPDTFVPSMVKKVEKGLSFKTIMENLSPDLEEDFESTKNYIIDPVTGQKVLIIPRLYNYSLAKETEPGLFDYDLFSKNLIMMYGKMAVYSEYYNSRNKLKANSHLLLELEKSKKMLAHDKNGIIKIENAVGEMIPEVLDSHNVNYDFLKQMTDHYIYGKGAFDPIKGQSFNFGDRKISKEKAIRFLMMSRSITTLGLNVKSALSTLMGGNLNAIMEGGRNGVFSMTDFLSANKKLGSYLANQEDDYGLLAKMHDIDPFIDDMSHERLNKLNNSKLGRIFTIENLMILMTKADRITQFKVMYATLLNHIITDGKLELISDVVKREMDFNNRYNTLILSKQFEKAKELQKEKESKIDEMKSKSLAYSKEDLTDEQMFHLRNLTRTLSKQILGNMSREDTFAGKLTLYGALASQFRSWIPRLLNVRFGDPEINMTTRRLEWGRVMTTWHAFANKQILPMIQSTIFGLNEIASGRINMEYERQKTNFLDNGGAIEDFPDLADFIEIYEGNVRSTLKEIAICIALGVLLYAIFSGDDDDKPVPAYKKYARTITKRMFDETIFWYNPSSLVTIVGNSAPVLQTLVDANNFVTHIIPETFNQVQNLFTNDEEKDLKRYKPTKYLFKMLPIFKESLSWMALFSDDFRKDWDIKL